MKLLQTQRTCQRTPNGFRMKSPGSGMFGEESRMLVKNEYAVGAYSPTIEPRNLRTPEPEPRNQNPRTPEPRNLELRNSGTSEPRRTPEPQNVRRRVRRLSRPAHPSNK